MTKKYFFYILFLIILVYSFIIAQNSLAWSFSDISGFTQKTAGEAGLSQTDYTVIVAEIITTILGIVGAIFVILFIYGGFIWLTSAGNEEKIGKAKKILSYAVIGVIIVATAYAITTFIAGAIPAGPGAKPSGETGTTGATDCTEAGGVCAVYDYCLRTMQGSLITSKSQWSQCPSQVCCKQPTSTQNCGDCGKGLTNICGESECTGFGIHCHFHYLPYPYCEYDPNWTN